MYGEDAATPNDGVRLHEFTLPEKVQAFTALSLVWSAHLSTSEVTLIGWLLANTVARGKRSGVYSLPQLVNGIPKGNGRGMWAAGTGMSEKTVRRTIASAVEKGVVHTSKDLRGTRFAVVLDWNPAIGTSQETNVVALNLSRAARHAPATSQAQILDDAGGIIDECGGQNDQGGVVKMTSASGQSDHPSIEKPTREITIQGQDPDTTASRPITVSKIIRNFSTGGKQVQCLARQTAALGNLASSPHCAAPPPAAGKSEPRQVVEALDGLDTEIQTERLQSARKRADTNAYETTWAASYSKTYPGTPFMAWTKKSAGMIKHVIERGWTERQRTQAHAFLEWCVTDWDIITKARFGSGKISAPMLPDIEFVARMIRVFQDAWADRETLRYRGTLPGARQAAHAMARRDGISLDIAIARVAAAEVTATATARLELLAAQARVDREAAMRSADRANRATRFTRENPHPRAHENVKRPAPIPIPIPLPEGTPDTPTIPPLGPVSFDAFFKH